MKTIRVKSYNKLIEKIINEDSIRLDGDTSDYKGKLKMEKLNCMGRSPKSTHFKKIIHIERKK